MSADPIKWPTRSRSLRESAGRALVELTETKGLAAIDLLDIARFLDVPLEQVDALFDSIWDIAAAVTEQRARDWGTLMGRMSTAVSGMDRDDAFMVASELLWTFARQSPIGVHRVILSASYLGLGSYEQWSALKRATTTRLLRTWSGSEPADVTERRAFCIAHGMGHAMRWSVLREHKQNDQIVEHIAMLMRHAADARLDQAIDRPTELIIPAAEGPELRRLINATNTLASEGRPIEFSSLAARCGVIEEALVKEFGSVTRLLQTMASHFFAGAQFIINGATELRLPVVETTYVLITNLIEFYDLYRAVVTHSYKSLAKDPMALQALTTKSEGLLAQFLSQVAPDTSERTLQTIACIVTGFFQGVAHHALVETPEFLKDKSTTILMANALAGYAGEALTTWRE